VTGNVGGNVTGTIGGLTAAALKDFFDTDSATTYASAVAGSVVKEIADNAGGASLTAADIADAVWEETIADHSGTAGSTAEALAAAGTAGDPWDTALPGAYGSGTAGKIIGDNLNATVSSRATQASVDTIDGIVDAILVDTGTTLDGAIATIDGIVDAILVDTGTTLDAKIDTIDGIVDAILVDTGTTLDTAIADLPTNAELATALGTADDAVLAQVALVKAKTDLIPASPAAVGSAMTLTSGERDAIAAALLDLANAVESGLTLRQALRLVASTTGAKLSGGGTGTEVFRNAVADSKDRVTATVDVDGNRTAITYDLT
jgi:hypothetical protein